MSAHSLCSLQYQQWVCPGLANATLSLPSQKLDLIGSLVPHWGMITPSLKIPFFQDLPHVSNLPHLSDPPSPSTPYRKSISYGLTRCMHYTIA